MRQMSKQEVLKRATNIAQLGYARRFAYAEGKARGMHAIDVKSAAGLRFTVLEDRGLDIYEMEYRGINLSFLTANGPVSGSRFIADATQFPSMINGGMMFTAGLMNVGGGCVDQDGTVHAPHGRIDGMSASEVSAKTTWDHEVLKTQISGKLTEAKLFGEKLELNRCITTDSSSPSVQISDTLFNASPIRTGYEVLYHINLGFPFLDNSVTLHTGKGKTIPRDAEAAKGVQDCWRMSDPIDGFPEQVFFHEIEPDPEGNCYAIAVNHNLGLGFYVQYKLGTLTHLCEWKSMASGDYVLGLEPSNNYLYSRNLEREHGTLKAIEGFETKQFSVTMGIVDGEQAIEQFMQEHMLG